MQYVRVCRPRPNEEGGAAKRLDRNGLLVRIQRVMGATSAPLRRRLEATGASLHLCKKFDCPLVTDDNIVHAKRYATLESEVPNGLLSPRAG